jgi:acyl-CoA reductase-like NAD-dependent aldehyde dehydrogenase
MTVPEVASATSETTGAEVPVRPALYIDGEWTAGTLGESTVVRAPYDGRVLARVPVASSADVERAINAAARAYRTVRLSPFERYEILSRASAIIREDAESFARTISDEAGKAIRDARIEARRAWQTFLLAAEEAKRIHGEGIPVEATPGSENRMAFTVREPIGVVCAITPFNAPLNQLNHKVPTAIAAGNTVVIKPAERTPLSAIRLVETLEAAGLPKGIVNLVLGPGGRIGDQLLADPRFSAYSFTGSTEIGERIRGMVGLRRTLLELGSNSATIVHRDANLDQAVEGVVRGGYAYAGQICISVQRVLVHEEIRVPFLDKLVARVRRLVVGDPSDDATEIGPMITVDQAERAESWIREAVTEGASLLVGGERNGAFISPAVLTDVRPEMKVVCMEAFAPLVTVDTYRTLDEAIASANDTAYGLQAGVFTSSLDVAMYLARRIEVGGVIINDSSNYRVDQMPYGGVKSSGMGREGVRYAIEELTDPKLIVMNLGRPE